MVTLVSANAYFGPTRHVLASVWAKYDGKQREAALYQANQLITRHTGLEPDDDATTTTDRPRPDLAVFEQALHMLRASPLTADGKTPTRKWDNGRMSDQETPQGAADPYAICEEAMRWLQWPTGNARTGARITMMRG